MTMYSLLHSGAVAVTSVSSGSTDQQSLIITSLQCWGACWEPFLLWRMGILGAAASESLGIGVLDQAGL